MVCNGRSPAACATLLHHFSLPHALACAVRQFATGSMTVLTVLLPTKQGRACARPRLVFWLECVLPRVAFANCETSPHGTREG